MTGRLPDFDRHPVLKARPNFSEALRSFESLLDATKHDLKTKKEAMENQKTILKNCNITLTNFKLISYISCQLCMLNKYQSRLEKFQMEINDRILKVLSPEDPYIESLSLKSANISNSDPSLVLENEPDRIMVSSTSSSNSSRSSGFADDDSLDSSASSSSSNCSDQQSPLPISEHLAVKDQQLLQLLADMTKMKRRCKHILDITDLYCSMQQPTMTLSLDPDESSKTSDVVDGSTLSTAQDSLPEFISQNLVKATMQSFKKHLAIITKTYSQKHAKTHK